MKIPNIDQCNITWSHFGNGITVWRTGEDNNIGHINKSRECTFRTSCKDYEKDFITILSLTLDPTISVSQHELVFDDRPVGFDKKILLLYKKLSDSGYAGIISNGNIVDRRIYPYAIAMQKSSILNIPKPKKL